MTAQQIAYALNTVGVILQLVGALLVVLDIRDGKRNTAAFKQRLDTAEQKRQEHLAALDDQFGATSGSSISRRPTLRVNVPEEARQALVNQVGPASAEERNALIAYVNDQNDRRGWQVWLGVILVVAGSLVAYAAAMITT